jgi:hypothetical protein
MRRLSMIVLYSVTTNRIVTKGYFVFSVRRHKSFGMWYCVIGLVVPDVMKSRGFFCPEVQVIQDVEEKDIIILTNSGTIHLTAQHHISESLTRLPYPHQSMNLRSCSFPVSPTHICLSVVLCALFTTFLLIMTLNESWMQNRVHFYWSRFKFNLFECSILTLKQTTSAYEWNSDIHGGEVSILI